ncbi:MULTISPECIES: DUF1133 family protein [Brenneria]|uniref:DUF1133 domain-containing protein n=1 Tax=Brenneria nigrifluens DSM 30175 = ATCC 13028 TaxID=1121120 RepID=A0A2U1UU11_9GAMM|nr:MULTISPECIES: DUF1133 family protein [Brenneria]EHD21802.1 hypothetical protein BrE312_2422 [Brenneria sp. EniD312]PWC25155.1 DUF1133 domain-containing protein [Brenneria nigrifluens DSM 30175 = ATCC 13028]QCR04911.1 DUF1133 family protein [Brenneria nigrifluens] [Brenneria nigrifluens DSM 30175 = ATCC 13028]
MKTVQDKSWQVLAHAPRRSYLGKYRRLKPSQNRWVRSLLNHWGSFYGGSGTEHLSGGGMWPQLMTGWSCEQQEKITTVLAGLREIGYQGDTLLIMAKKILWPKRTLGDLIGNAGDEEEAAFMERMILQSFSKDSPVYEIGRDYYTWNKSIAAMARWLNYKHAPFLTEKQCVDRVRWCIELFNSAVYFTLFDELCSEDAETSEK